MDCGRMLSSVDQEFELWGSHHIGKFEITAPGYWTGRKSKEEIVKYLEHMQFFAAAALELVNRVDS